MPTYHGIGTMSGTSMDGLDLAYVKFIVEGDSYQWELLQSDTIPFDETWRSRLMYLAEQSAETYAKTHVYLGHWYGRQVKQFIETHQLKPDFVANHGQTIFHQPQKNFTAQIGDGESMVSYLPCPLVSNFRNKDVALGGEGAPLVPLGEKFLFPDHQLFLNLGGIANLSYLSKAFDVCPCNGVLNLIYSKAFPEAEINYDKGGSFAQKGDLSADLLGALNQLPYYQQTPPKSLGWEWVQDEVLPLLAQFPLAPEDMLRTLVEHMAIQIGSAVERYGAPAQRMMITGGGRHHELLMERINFYQQESQTLIDTSFPSAWVDYKEAIVFAFLGLRTLLGRPTTLASVTGAKQDVLTGAIHVPPTNSGLPGFLS